MKISKEAKIGFMGVIALVVLFFGINFLKGVNFGSQNIYYIRFSNAKGLGKNSTVFADGYSVGSVSDIIYDYDSPGQVLIKVALDRNLRIPYGSSAMLDEAILGGCTLNLLLVNNLTDAYQPGDTIQGSDKSGLMSKAGDLMPQVETVLMRVDSLLVTLNALAGNPDIEQTLSNVRTLTEHLDESAVKLKQLMAHDVPRMTKTFNTAGENVVRLTDNLNQLNLDQTVDSLTMAIGNVNRLLTQVQSKEGSLGLLMNDTRLYDNLNHTVQSADSLLNDLKAHPKRYVHFSVFGRK